MYLTYEEYTALGGTVAETSFPNLERKIRREIDFITQYRLKDIDTSESTENIPIEVKELMTDCIELLNANSDILGSLNLKSYSNGVETFAFKSGDGGDISSILSAEYEKMAAKYLPPELTYKRKTRDELEAMREDNE